MNTFQKICAEEGVNMVWSSTSQYYFLGYLFRRVTAIQFNNRLKSKYKLNVEQANRIRKRLDTNGYILLNMKLWLFRSWKSPKTTDLYLAKRRIRYGIEMCDANIRFPSSLEESMNQLNEYRSFSLKGFEEVLSRITQDVDEYTSKLIYRKLRFLISNPHNGVNAFDLKNEVIYHAIRNVMMTYPKMDNYLHAVNIAKRNVHNYSMNIINYMTRPCRANTVRNSDGTFSSVLVSWDATIDMSVDPSSQSTDKSNVQSDMSIDSFSPDYSDNLISQMSWEKIYTTVSSKKKKLCLICLMGIYNPHFTHWLKENAKSQHAIDNDRLYANLEKRDCLHVYSDYLSKFLDVSTKNIDKFLYQVGEMITVPPQSIH